MAKQVNTINFGPGTQNADLAAQQEALARRQKIASMLRDQAMQSQQTEMVSGRAIDNRAGSLSKLFQAGLSASMEKQDEGKQAAIGQDLAKRQAEQLRKLAPAGVFSDEAQVNAQPDGQPATLDPNAPQQQAPSMDPAKRAQWARAIATYQQNPELGGKLIQDLSKEEEFATTPQYDQNGKAFVLGNRNTVKMLDGVSARDKMENVNGVWQNPYAQANGATGPQDPNAPFMVGPDGKPVANKAYQAYTFTKARAGAPNITTRVENKAAESIAAQIGPMLKDSATAAEGAVSQIDAAERVIKAIDSNKIYAGPLASKRLALAQFGQVLGVGGKDEAETIAATRQVVRGMAEMTLQGRKQMSGQGAITESESKLAEKATSGDIDSLTPAELKIIAGASRRAAQHTLSNHQRKVNKARDNPATSGIAEYFDTPGYGGQSVDDLLKKYGGQ